MKWINRLITSSKECAGCRIPRLPTVPEDIVKTLTDMLPHLGVGRHEYTALLQATNTHFSKTCIRVVEHYLDIFFRFRIEVNSKRIH